MKQRYRRRRLERLGVAEHAVCGKTELGSGGGAWTACLDGIGEGSIVYSFGAGTDISFDLDLNARTGAQVHIFDPTPRAIDWMHRQTLPSGVSFHEYGIGAFDGTIRFYPPRRAGSSHFSPVQRYRLEHDGEFIEAPVFRISTIAERLGHDHIALVKMDIEGGEYDVIRDLVASPLPVDQLLVEFHHGYSTIPVARTVETISLLASAGFDCFHISARTYEFSFLRR